MWGKVEPNTLKTYFASKRGVHSLDNQSDKYNHLHSNIYMIYLYDREAVLSG